MSTVFIGGSRHVSRLPIEVQRRLDNVVATGHHVIVGDANGADKAVQKHFMDVSYDKVGVYCSGATPRNNLGSWPVHNVDAPKTAKGFQFYAAKDRAMAAAADFGLMIWDGKSPGTVLNILRLVRAGKISVLFNVAEKTALNIKSAAQWRNFLEGCSPQLVADLKERATEDEWGIAPIESVSSAPPKSPTLDDLVLTLNRAFASGDAATVMAALGGIARERGMSQIARDTGLARESLYRSLDAGGNPEFATVLKVFSSIGLQLEAKTA
jgi:probable addiction module antidote protein